MIRDKLTEDMKTAMKGGDKLRLGVIRMLISELKNERIAQGKDLDDASEIRVVNGYAKKRREAIDAARAGGRDDIANREQAEYDITMSYLPRQLTEDEVRAIVRRHADANTATGPQAFGAVMKAVMADIAGQADGKLVSSLVREMTG
ncbi:MAG TPA: GatB/YqeY domain-containing protein [Candidatus Krumholzibacteria bacterium]|nr:GatB/YqeY domain-containing protein [Candidatus Krumholzibacteria bacterium]